MSGFLEQYLGEVFALTTAIVWAFAVILFKKSGEAVHPLGLNVFKCFLAIVLLAPTTWLFGQSLFRAVPISDYMILLVSGALGIGISDTLFFKSLNALGAGLSAIVDCLYSPFIISMSLIWLGESLTFWQLVGATLIVSAVLSIILEKHTTTPDKKRIYWGVFWGAAAMLTNAVGIVMVKPLLTDSPLFWATEWRLVGGTIILVLALLLHPRRRAILASIKAPHRLGYTISSSLIGTYLGMVLWLAGMKYTQASTTAALNQTSNIFVFIFAALILKEKITLVRMIAICLGVGGALLVTFGS
ncbi:MAG: DMT family transporter [bacterium]|nr:DMT family transporter [bacterium]